MSKVNTNWVAEQCRQVIFATLDEKKDNLTAKEKHAFWCVFRQGVGEILDAAENVK